MGQPTPPFAAQRVVFFALLMGVLVFAAVVAVVIDQNGGQGLAAAPIEALKAVGSSSSERESMECTAMSPPAAVKAMRLHGCTASCAVESASNTCPPCVSAPLVCVRRKLASVPCTSSTAQKPRT